MQNILLHAVAAAACQCAPNPDLDRSGVVDTYDIAIVLASWGLEDHADLTGDGVTSQADLLTVINAQGERWLYAQTHDDHAGPRALEIRVDAIEAVREDGWNTHLILDDGRVALAAGNVIWWVFELHDLAWEGPVWLSETRLRALGALEHAEPPAAPDGLWLLRLRERG